MEKFYKYFTISVIALLLLGGMFYYFGKRFSMTVSAQNNERKLERCDKYKIIVLEESQQRAVHAAYDFENQIVSIVQIQKTFNPPNITVTSKGLVGK